MSHARGQRRFRRKGLGPGRRGLVLALVALASWPACATWQGARLYHSGSRALEQGQTERAIHDLEAAARLVPESSEIQNHLGIAYLDSHREVEALRAFERAVELDCDNQAAQRNLAALQRNEL